MGPAACGRTDCPVLAAGSPDRQAWRWRGPTLYDAAEFSDRAFRELSRWVQAEGMSRMVGRDAECAVLRHRLTAPHGGPGAIVLVAGEAGVGKTALVEHVLADATAPTLYGRAAEWAARAYDVLAGALRPVIRGTGEPVPDLLAQIIPELGAPPPEPDPAALAAAVCSVLTGAAGDRQVALFLDDLQWADEATLGLLPALADAGSGLPVTVIGCYRSDELPRGHRLRSIRALLRRNHQLTEIELAPLSDEDVTRMLAALLGAVPQPALAAAVAGRADGLPFAVEELAFALRDGGHLAYSDGTVMLAGTGAAPVPDGIREAVLLRAARLTDEERALVEAAAVAGNEFDIDTIVAATGVPAWPDGFTGSGLLTDSGDGRAAFRHPLTREAAYADIPWSRRRRLHRALAGTLTADRAAPSLIAAHLLAARDFEPARRALVAAAEQHCAVHAYRDAAHALRMALDSWPSDEEDDTRLLVIDRLARCAEMCAEYADAVTLLRELAGGHQRRGDNHALAVAHRRLALAHELRGQWESALAAREAAALAFSAAGLPAEAAIDRLAVATHLRSAASYSVALATLGAVYDDAQSAGRRICCCAPRVCGAMCCRAWAGHARESPLSVRHWTRRSLDHSPTLRPSCSNGWPTRSSIPATTGPRRPRMPPRTSIATPTAPMTWLSCAVLAPRQSCSPAASGTVRRACARTCSPRRARRTPVR